MSTPHGEVGVERIAMTTKEVQRGSVLAQVAARKLLLTAAARVLGFGPSFEGKGLVLP